MGGRGSSGKRKTTGAAQSQKWQFPEIQHSLDRLDSAIDGLRNPFGSRASSIFREINHMENMIEQARSDVKSGIEDGDIKALARYHTRLKALRSKFLSKG